MDRSARARSRRSMAMAGVLAITACSPEPTRVVELPDAQLAKAPSTGVTVTSTDPGYARRGERRLIRILGSGFTATSSASWERAGIVDPGVTVLSTTFVSSTEVVADVQIAPDADLAFYDVAITITLVDGGRKKGIGIEKFEVTSAILLPELSGPGNNSVARGVNDAGQVVGRSNANAFYWDAATGIDDLGPGQGNDITAAGTTIIGADYIGTPRNAVVWTGTAHSWSVALLSTACATNIEWSTAKSISPDGSLIVGHIAVTGPRGKSKGVPVAWDNAAANCRLLGIPSEYDGGVVNEVSATGMIAGGVSNSTTQRAVVWDAAGAVTQLSPVPGDSYGLAYAISPNGMIVAGMSGDRPAYWVRTESGWSAGIPLTVRCSKTSQSYAHAVNDSGIVMGSGCDGGRWWQVAGTTIVSSGLMPGLGPTDHPIPEAITNNSMPGQPWAAGGGAGATYWRIP
jgi:hypothetical protein